MILGRFWAGSLSESPWSMPLPWPPGTYKHTHKFADNFPFFLTFFRAPFVTESLFFLWGNSVQTPSPKPTPVGSLSSTEKCSSEVPEIGGFSEENCLRRGGVDREKKEGCATEGRVSYMMSPKKRASKTKDCRKSCRMKCIFNKTVFSLQFLSTQLLPFCLGRAGYISTFKENTWESRHFRRQESLGKLVWMKSFFLRKGISEGVLL